MPAWDSYSSARRESLTRRPTPRADKSLCQPSSLAAIRDELLALIEDLRKHPPIERLIAIGNETEKDRWGIETPLLRLGPHPLVK